MERMSDSWRVESMYQKYPGPRGVIGGAGTVGASALSVNGENVREWSFNFFGLRD